MVRQIHLKKLYEQPDNELLGRFPTEEDYDEVIDEDCDVYLPDGSLAVVFRKRAVKSLLKLKPGTQGYEYWKWAGRALMSDQRGYAAGNEIVTNLEIRLTEGQKTFFSQAVKGKVVNLEEALVIVNGDTRPARTTYYIGKTEKDGLVDLEEIERWDVLVRKKTTSAADKQEAVRKRNAAKLAWFDTWLRKHWAVAEDKVAEAKRARARYVTNQPRGNKAYSAVFGAIDRAGRTPFGRLTKPTLEKYETFCSFEPFYKEIDSLVKKYMPERWQVLYDRFQHVKDERYNLFGTCFTSITMNYNFQVAAHRDGNNAKDALAVLTALDGGEFEGFEFIMHPMRLAFNLRHGDFFCGDNQSVVHSITEMRNASEDAESITFVFYQRDAIIKLDSLECEECRKDFMAYCVKHHPEKGTGEDKWAGSFPSMWCSPEWRAYRELRTRESKVGYDYTQCSETNYYGNPDTPGTTRARK